MWNRELDDDYNRILEEYGIKPPSEIAQANIDIARSQMRAQRQSSFLSPAPMQPNEESEEDRVRAVRAQYDWDFETGAPRVFEQPVKQNPAQLQAQQAAEPQSIDDRIKEMYAESMRKKTASSPQKNNQVQAQVPIQDMVMDDTPEPDIQYGMGLPRAEVDIQSYDDRIADLVAETNWKYEEDPQLKAMREANERHFAQVRGLMDGAINAQAKGMQTAAAPARVSNGDKDFQKSIAFSLQYEGGQNFYVKDGKAIVKGKSKADKGGATAFGITAPILKEARKAGIVKHSDITKLTQAEAQKIYKKNYWDRYGWGELASPANLCCLDCSINHGQFAKILQRAARDCGQNIKIDGKYSKATLKALKACDPVKLAQAIVNQRRAYYNGIVAAHPEQKVHLRGWMNRVNGMARAAGVR